MNCASSRERGLGGALLLLVYALSGRKPVCGSQAADDIWDFMTLTADRDVADPLFREPPFGSPFGTERRRARRFKKRPIT
jgi:hypothetical protein